MVTEMPGNIALTHRMWESNRAARAARTLVQFFDVSVKYQHEVFKIKS